LDDGTVEFVVASRIEDHDDDEGKNRGDGEVIMTIEGSNFLIT
jgi:hypothetical protein